MNQQRKRRLPEVAEHQFNDDAPRENPWKDDDLGFGPFSRRVALALIRQEAKRGYVFGLHGEWGSGKSTILNFVRAHLAKWKEETAPETLNLQWFSFEPWIVSGHQDLAAAFFKVLSETLADGEERKANARRMARGAIDAGADKVIDAAASLGAAIDHTGGTVSKVGALLAKAATKKAAVKWLSEPSLQKTYKQLVDRLGKSDKRFIVFVDDIDRLTSEEIRALMQMVKTVGRLPNVTYCLTYDRQIVWTALAELAPGDERRSGFAEKIVQHEMEVPVPSRSVLMRMLAKGMPELPSAPDRGMRWIEIQRAGLNRWLRHPRDIVKLSNAMHFAWAALEGEVDAYDVMCMEAMRLFDRKAFDWVRNNRDLLLGEGLPRVAGQEDIAKEADKLGDRLAEGARADIVPVLRLLFPSKVDLFGRRRGLSQERHEETVRRRGIGSKAGYTAYFSLSPSPNAVPIRMLQEASAPGTSRSRHAELIDAALGLVDEQGFTLVGEYFQEISYRVSTMRKLDLEELLRALIERSVAVFSIDEDAGGFGPSSQHHILIGQIYDKLGSKATADLLEELFGTADDVGALAAIYVDLARALGEIPTDGATRRDYIPAKRLPALGALLLPKIEAAAAEDCLTALPHYYEVARAWARLGHLDEARQWLAKESRRDGHTLAKVSRGMLGQTLDGGRPRYNLYRDPDVDLYDVDALAEGCSLFRDQQDLSIDERDRIRALAAGLDTIRRKQALGSSE